jgi:hypothetical protein
MCIFVLIYLLASSESKEAFFGRNARNQCKLKGLSLEFELDEKLFSTRT